MFLLDVIFVKKKIFIDGSAGTTGLDILRRLSDRDDIEILTLAEADRKDAESRKAAINSSDIAFLCLPDAAAKEAALMVENDDTVIIDTSTAHRTNPEWAYGFPELSSEAFGEKIANSKRIAVPGCHASGFIALVYPLVKSGIIEKSTLLSCFSLTGYSGGGKNMISAYEDSGRDALLSSPRQYALSQTHKHLPEMTAVTGLENAPVFCPTVADFYSGMEVSVPLFSEFLKNGANMGDIKRIYAEKYTGPVVSYKDNTDEAGFLAAGKLSGTDRMEISVYGNDERMLLTARYDNLGKGACGAAIECLNLVLGTDMTKGMNI